MSVIRFTTVGSVSGDGVGSEGWVKDDPSPFHGTISLYFLF